MKSIHKIIAEEIGSFLKENDEQMYELYEAQDRIKEEIFNDFLYQNNQDFTKNIGWQLIPFTRLKKIWEDYMRMGVVRDVKGLEAIERIAIRNALKINVITELAGHTSYGSSEEDIEENIGHWVDEQMSCILPQEEVNTDQLEIPYDDPAAGNKQKEPVNVEPCQVQIHPFAQSVIDEFYNPANMDREDARGKLFDEMLEKFFDYLTDPNSGHIYLSDYGLPAIMTQASKLYVEQVPEKKVVLIDSILNVVHQRSDMASWFVQGGSQALSNLSGYEVPDEEAGGYDTQSVISGRYKMGDYK